MKQKFYLYQLRNRVKMFSEEIQGIEGYELIGTTELDVKPIETYPCYKKHKTSHKLIVYFTGEGVGYVVRGDQEYPVTFKRCDWYEESFTRIKDIQEVV